MLLQKCPERGLKLSHGWFRWEVWNFEACAVELQIALAEVVDMLTTEHETRRGIFVVRFRICTHTTITVSYTVQPRGQVI